MQRDRSAQVCWRTGREWTGPNDGAVKVTNTAGWVATAGVMPLPPIEPGADEVVGVAAVGLGAAGADGDAPVAAWLVDHPVRHADRGDGAQQLAGGGVDVADVAAQPDRAGAGGGGPDVIEPGVVSGVVQSGEDAFVGELEVQSWAGQDR